MTGLWEREIFDKQIAKLVKKLMEYN